MQIGYDNITAILDACLERMRYGESIESCMLDYPFEAEELEPLLIAAVYARSTFRPPSLAPEARQAIRRQLQQAVAARQPAQRRSRGSWFGPFVLRVALMLVVVFLSLGGGVAAAQSSLPGSPLYALKRTSEGVRLRLASSAAERATLHLDFAAARSAEILSLASGEQKTVDNSLVDALDQDYQLAWGEIGQSPAGEVHDLVSRYVAERQTDVKLFSATLVRANAATRLQMQRAVLLSEHALALVAPARVPIPQSDPDTDVNSGSIPGDHQDQPGQEEPTKGGITGANGAPNSSAIPGDKPADAGPAARPVGKPAGTGPQLTPKAQVTPEGKPADVGPQATPEGKPTSAGPQPKPKPKPDHGKP